MKNKLNNIKKLYSNVLLYKNSVPYIHNNRENIILEKEYYDFYFLYPKVESRPFYARSPLFSIINKNKKNILNNLIFIFNSSYDFKLKIGLELEFYLLNNVNKINIIKELKKVLPFVENIEEEQGKNQFEIKTKPYIDIELLINDYLKIIEILKTFSKSNNLELLLEPLPFEGDCGSSLQINISIIDINNNNLFARVKNQNNFTESKLMLNSIAGLLDNINNNLLFYINDESSLLRFDLEKNKIIQNNNKYPAPTFISWGINNRTASIRIPTPRIIDFNTYMQDDNKNRRIEYRIPPSNADIYLTLIGVISAIIEGIDDGLMPNVDKTSFNIIEKNDNLTKIENNFDIINDIFKVNKDIFWY